jgi:hypothetical protein
LSTVPPEFTFEVRVCRWAERAWPPDDREAAAIVGRQLGTEHRRWDTVVVEVAPDAFARRAAADDRALDRDLLRVVRNAPGDWAWYRDALPEWCPWRYVREAVHGAAERGWVETRREGGRLELRRRRAYPDWVRRVVAIENKPDLDASAARDLRPQLEHDIALGLADAVWVASRATGDRIEPILLDDLPVEAGVLLLDPDAADGTDPTVAWEPRRLDADATGTRMLDRPTGGPHDASAARFEYADPGRKELTRLAIAERAFERGWRSYADTVRPDCRWFLLRHDGSVAVPWCGAKGRHQSVAECSGSCPAFEPEPPSWRTHGPPIEGGPGAALDRGAVRPPRRRLGLERRARAGTLGHRLVAPLRPAPRYRDAPVVPEEEPPAVGSDGVGVRPPPALERSLRDRQPGQFLAPRIGVLEPGGGRVVRPSRRSVQHSCPGGVGVEPPWLPRDGRISPVRRVRVEQEHARFDGEVVEQDRFDPVAGRPRGDPDRVGQPEGDVVLQLRTEVARGARVEVGLVLDRHHPADPVGVRPPPAQFEPPPLAARLDPAALRGPVDRFADVPPRTPLGERVPVPRPVPRCVPDDAQEVAVQRPVVGRRPPREGVRCDLHDDGVPAPVFGSELPPDDRRRLAVVRRPRPLRPPADPHLERELRGHGRQRTGTSKWVPDG